jgi:hypothetical protein
MEEKFRITDNAVREVAGERTLCVQRLSDHVAKADQDAERVQNLIPQNLELKRSYTAMKEAHNTAILELPCPRDRKCTVYQIMES